MSSISGISSSLASSYSHMSTGKRINSAKDDAAGLAIVEKENAQVTGYNVGTRNMQTAQDMLNVSDGALSGISDSLQRIRELAVAASNTATVSDSERSAMQAEVEQLKQGISDIASQTTFNTMNILDGTNQSFNIATDGNGNSQTVNTANATLDALGLTDFDLTKDFDVETIDKAIEAVNSSRANIGAQSNTLDYAIGYSSQASYNLTGATSRIQDLDYGKAVTEKKKQEIIQQYSLMMQKKKMEQEKNKLNVF